VVSGPHLPSERLIVAGEQLVVSASRMELRTTSKSDDGATGRLTAQPVTTGSRAAPNPTAPNPVPAAGPGGSAAVPEGPRAAAPGLDDGAPGRASAPSAPSPSWKALASSGKHKEAMDAAEAAGFSAEVARASASELLALSDAARFAGRPARAKEALLAMRKRFGARGQSAFLLGKISADQLRSPGEAAVWFETYLQEEPGGALAEQALGRLMELRKRDAGAARLVAERYLARYPTGAYAKLARSLVGR
jgi:transmembrane sensor